MIKNRSFICFGEDISHTPLSRFHIMKRLARFNKVLYVESIGMRRPEASSGDVKRVASKVRRWLRGCRRLQDSFFVLSLFVVPFHEIRFVRRLNGLLLRFQLSYWKLKLGLENLIIWIGPPTARPIVGSLDEELLIYHCTDKYPEYVPPERKPVVSALHKEMLVAADLTLAPSKVLCEELREYARNCGHLPHGVDYDHFASAQNSDLGVPDEVAGLPRPVIGFFGTIDSHWIDFELMKLVAASRPDWSFLFIGPVRDLPEAELVAELENVRFLGPKPYSELPAYSKAFDVCIVPKVRTPLTEASSPLKIWEYLATGKPVVSTLKPDNRLGDLVYVAETHEDFIHAIEESMANDSPARKMDRMNRVQEHSWDSRVELLSDMLEWALERKESEAEANA